MGRLSRALAVAGLAVGTIPAMPGPAHAATLSSGDEAQFVTLINQLRSSKGLGALAVNGRLTAEARAWSANMAASGLKENPDIAAGAPSGWRSLGENVGAGSSVGQVEQAFVNSPSHYVNLVNPSFNQVGVGVVVSNGTLWVTQDFMDGPLGAVAAAPPPSAPRPATSAPRPPAPAAPPPPLPAAIEPPPPPVELVTVLGVLESLDGAPTLGAGPLERRVS
jgi:Cysteine-rich secretory protein family